MALCALQLALVFGSGEGELPDADRVSYQTAFPKEGACKHPAPPCHLPSCCSIHHVPRASGAWD